MSSENKSISTVLALAACALSLAANADRHWTGGGATTDWTDNANWGAGNGSGNWVFGGAKVANLPSTDPIICTFSNAVTISSGVWIENGAKANVVWMASENADEGAGLKTTWGTNNSLNIGTGTHGGLTIESGVYYMPKQLWIGNGAADSFFTLNGGVFTNQSYTCIGYGGYSRTATMTVNGGTFRQNGDKFIIGQGNNTGCIGIYNQTGGEVSVPEIFMSENKGSSSLTVSGGTFTNRGYASIGRGASTVGEVVVAGGKFVNVGEFVVGYGDGSEGKFTVTDGTCDMQNLVRFGRGTNSKATVLMSGGEFDTDNECILCTGTGSTADMTLSGGSFTPRKLWIGSHFSHTSSGCNATFTMTGGTLTTDNDQDIVVGGNANAVGTFNMQGGTVNCGKRFHIAWRGSGTLNMTGGDIYVPAGQDLCFNNDTGTSATMQLDGGTFHTDTITMSTREGVTQTLTVNGGSFAPVTDKADWLAGVPMTVGPNGIGLASGGHSATLSANLTPAAAEQPIKAVFTGADRSGVISFSSSTFEQIDSFEIAANGVMVVTKGGAVEKPLKIEETGMLVVDVSGQILTDGDYDLVTLSGGLVDTTISSDNVDIAGLPGVATLTYTVENNVLKVNVSGLERMVLNVNGGDWSGATTWKGETSGTVRAFGAKDRAAFVIAEDDTVQTVLVNTDVAPLGVDVEVTGENSYALIKGHGTFAPAELCVKGTIGLAGDAEGPLNLDVALERTLEDEVDVSKALFAEGTVNLLTSLHMDSTVNGKLVREKDWTPSYKIDGSGEIQIKNAKLTLDNKGAWLQNFSGTVTLGPGCTFDDAKDLNQPPIFGGATLKMAGATISRFSWNDAAEYLNDVIIADGTESTWWNQQSRGSQGAHVNINGDISGSGKLIIQQKGWEPARCMKFNNCTFEGFTGTIEMHGINYEFWKPIKSGTFICTSGMNVGVATPNLSIDKDVTWIMNNNGTYNLTCLSGATIGGDGNGKVNNLTLNEGVKFRFTSYTALTDLSAEYVALTVANPISGPLPTLENADNERGKWKLVVREVPAETEEGSPTYQLVAEFQKKGFIIIID